MQRCETVLLITSTIAPAPRTFALKVTDANSRLVEYCTAFRFYLRLLDKKLVDRIVYADNSGYSLAALKRIAIEGGRSEQIEFISFQSDTPIHYSRYYLETQLIQTAFAMSKVLDDAKDQRIWKVTGRYLVRNIAKVITTAPLEFDLYVNCRNRPVRTLDFFLVGFLSTSFSRLLARDPEHYRVSEPAGEILLRSQIDKGEFAGLKIVPRLRVTPMVTAGRRGMDGVAYWNTKGIGKYLTRRIANRLLPRLWI